MFLIGNFKKKKDLKIIFIKIPIFFSNCFKKKSDLPYLKFLNSKSIIPPLIFVNQESNLPFPLPIRVPVDFFDRGKWGKAKNQNFRFVFSDFLILFLKNNLNLKIVFEVSWRGFNKKKPIDPKFNLILFLKFLQILFFWNFFDLNVFGCNNRKSH